MDTITLEKLKMELSKYLSMQSISCLRSLGRKIGVDRSTTKKKEVLIDEMVDIFEGKQAPVLQSKRGAPVKNDFIDPLVWDTIEHYRLKMQSACLEGMESAVAPFVDDETDIKVHASNKKEGFAMGTTPYLGQVVFYKGVYALFPLDGRGTDSEIIVISSAQMESYSLRVGDVLSCYLQREGSGVYVGKILSINWISSNLSRVHFNEEKSVYPSELIAFTNSLERGFAPKTLDVFAPCGHGQRVLITSPFTVRQNTFMGEIVRSLSSKDGIRFIYFSLDASPEKIEEIRENLREEEFLYATYEDTPDFVLFLASIALERGKRLAELGEKVCLVIDNFNKLASACEHAKGEKGAALSCGLNSQTITYCKGYLGSAKRLKSGGSLTIIGGCSSSNDYPASTYLCRELDEVANCHVKLKYPPYQQKLILDFQGTGAESEDLLTRDTKIIVDLIKQKLLPEVGEEKLCERMEEDLPLQDWLSDLENIT